MHKTKKAIQDLKQYLGKDQMGLNLLAEISEQVNDLRKALATEMGQSERAADRAERAVVERKAAVAESAELAKKLRTTRDRYEQASRNVSEWESRAAKLQKQLDGECDDDAASLGKFEQFSIVKSVMRQLRKRLRVCPRRVTSFSSNDSPFLLNGKTAVYDLHDIVSPKLTRSDLLTLGMFTAVMAAHRTPVVVAAETGLFDIANEAQNKGEITDAEKHKLIGPFVKWWLPNNVNDKTSLEAAVEKLLKRKGRNVTSRNVT